MASLTLTWSDWRWWGTALSGGLYIMIFFLSFSLARRQLVRYRLGSAKPVQEWRPSAEVWTTYQKRWSSALLGQLVTWVVFYALILAVLDRTGGFLHAFSRYAVFSVLVLGPFAVAIFLLTRFRATTYSISERGIGSFSWSPFSIQGTAGLTDSAFRPWANILGYYWAEGDLVLVVKRSFLSPQKFTVIMPPGGRRTLEDVLHEHGLNKVAKEKETSPARGSRSGRRGSKG